MSISIYDCPQCGAPVKFQSSVAVFVVCEHCLSMVVRRDADVEAMGTMAQLPPDLSPLQLGTRGQWDGKAFELVGRLRLAWEDGSWTEWYALFPDGRTGWVAESQGFYMVSFATQSDGDIPGRRHLRAGASLRFAQQQWTVVDVKDATCIAGEGELPFIAAPGEKRTGADLTGADGGFATLEFSDEGDEPQLFVGAYAEFSGLQFSNLRPVPGWSAEVDQIRHQTTALNCPGCGAAVNLRAAGQTMSAVCGSCGAIIDTANPQWIVVQEADEKVRKMHSLLPIGVRGKLDDIEWEVIGLVNRADPYSRWQEYLLFNPWQGFRWLVTYDGHWSWVRRMPEIGSVSGNEIRLDGHVFKLYARNRAVVRSVLGEFYWQVRRGEEALLEDYIHPPQILSKETYPGLNEFTWSLGEYIDHTKVTAAFEIKNPPEPVGVYLNQPNPFAEKSWPIWWRAIFFVAGLILIEFLFATGSNEHPVFNSDFQFVRGPEAAGVISTPHFQLDGRQGPVQLEVTAGLDNQWLGFDFDLVNAQTNETYEASLEVSYYHGYDDGAWSEGSQTNSVDIPAVPPGEYFLNIETDADPALERMSWSLEVTRGGLFWSNFFIGLALILAYPIYLSIRKNSFERQRWSGSDYSPFTSKDSDDD